MIESEYLNATSDFVNNDEKIVRKDTKGLKYESKITFHFSTAAFCIVNSLVSYYQINSNTVYVDC